MSFEVQTTPIDLHKDVSKASQTTVAATSLWTCKLLNFMAEKDSSGTSKVRFLIHSTIQISKEVILQQRHQASYETGTGRLCYAMLHNSPLKLTTLVSLSFNFNREATESISLSLTSLTESSTGQLQHSSSSQGLDVGPGSSWNTGNAWSMRSWKHLSSMSWQATTILHGVLPITSSLCCHTHKLVPAS